MRTKFSRTAWTWSTQDRAPVDIDREYVHKLGSRRWIVAERQPSGGWFSLAVVNRWPYAGQRPGIVKAPSLEALALAGAQVYVMRWSAVKRVTALYGLKWRRKSECKSK